MTIQRVEVKREGLTLSQIIWGTLRQQPAGFLEIVLDANVGLADLVPFLPVGTVVLLPVDKIPPLNAPRAVTRLWD